MANLATRVLRLLVRRGHAMLGGELAAAFPGAKQTNAVHQAVHQLSAAKCITWTDQGWLATDAGRQYVRVNTRLLFDRERRAARAGDR